MDAIIKLIPQKHKMIYSAAIVFMVTVYSSLVEAGVVSAVLMVYREVALGLAAGLGGLSIRHAMKKQQNEVKKGNKAVEVKLSAIKVVAEVKK